MRRKPFPRRNDESSGGNVLILSSILNDGTGPLALFFLRRSIGLHSPGNFPGTQVITFSSREYISRSPSSIGLKGNCVSARLFSLLGKIARMKKCGAPFSLFNRLIGKFIGSVLTSSHHAWTAPPSPHLRICTRLILLISYCFAVSRSYRLQFYISSLHPYPRPDLDLS